MRLRGFAVLPIALLLLVALTIPAFAADGWPVGSLQVALQVQRLGGPTRFDTAVSIAAAGWPGWSGITHVIVASGENRAFSDPLAAGSLCWAYDAPLLLVRGADVPQVTASALRAIVAANGAVKVVVVGGTVAVSSSALAQLHDIVGSDNVERLVTGGDRYDLAAAIAARVRAVAAETGRDIPPGVLVANGTNDAGFVDALALSAVSARTGIPILLVSRDQIPDATRAALRSLTGSEVIVAGSSAVVSGATYSALGATARWAGPNRYATAVEIAKSARVRGWLDGTSVGIAAAVPDALTGATYAGRSGAPLLYSISHTLGQPVAAYLASVGPALTQANIFGSAKVVSAAVEQQLGGAPTQPSVISPIDAPYLAKRATIRARVGVNTSEVRLYRNGVKVASATPAAYSTVDFGSFDTPADGATYRVEAVNPLGGSSSWQKAFKRLTYPSASTSIVIDKSEFRLYLVKSDVLIKHYPVAIGRPSMETPVRLWRVGALYKTDPSSVYGPRKMRLYKWTGSAYVYTNYAIHGTNEPWVIGTKASHGCIRLYNSDVLDLYPQVPIGTLVQTRE